MLLALPGDEEEERFCIPEEDAAATVLVGFEIVGVEEAGRPCEFTDLEDGKVSFDWTQ